MTRFPLPPPAAKHAAAAPEAARPMHELPAPPIKACSMRARVATLLCLLGPAAAQAQDTTIGINPESASVALPPGELPRLVAGEAIRFYKPATTTPPRGRPPLPAGHHLPGAG